jgi:two-component system sensor histidine kinase KdpD
VVPLSGKEGHLGALYVAWAPGRPRRDYEERLLWIFGRAVALALENARWFARAAERARREAEEAAALGAISAALASTLQPAELYTLILQEAARVLPFDHAEIVLYRDGWAVSVASLGEPSVPPETPLVQLDPATSTWRALVQGEAVFVADTAELLGWRDLPPWVGPYRIRSSLRVPLLVEGELLGTFAINSFTPRFYSEGQVRVALAFGERAAQALRNARLYAAEQERARAAEELAQLRSDFVASVSHELRTPLTAIIGFAELLRARWDRMSEAHRSAQIDRIVLAAQRQQRLVEDLLLVTRLEQGALQPHPEPVELASLVRQAVDEVRGAYRGQLVDLQGPEGAVVLADAGYALQILANLLDNAAKYSPEGSPITVQWGAEGELVAVRVRDHGSGIPAGARAQLFTRFGRVPGSRMRAGRAGTGLGLYLSRTLAAAMGGSLELEESSPQGSTFLLRLPGTPIT